MSRTLATFATSDVPPGERLRVAREIAEAVASLHAAGRVHGALSPERVLVAGEGAVVILPPPAVAEPPICRAGFDAPEVARGGRPTRRSDAFSAGALAWFALAGRPPFDADEPLARVQRALFAAPAPSQLAAPSLPLAEAAIAAALDKRPRRRVSAAMLAEALTSSPSPTTAGGAGTLAARALAAVRSVSLARPPFLRELSPLHHAGLVALALLLVAIPFLRGDAALAREITSRLEEGDVQGARRRIEAVAKERPDDPLVEKLRGDVACARGATRECIRRYRVVLASRPELREDRTLRMNARRLVHRDQACSTRRAAAHLLGELRDPEALPALERSRRSGGIFAVFCTGDALERAIAMTRASMAR